MSKINDREFLKWINYARSVIPFCDYQLMREFKITNDELQDWIKGSGPKEQSVRHAVIIWMIDSGYRFK